MNSQFTWVPFYEELAKKLLEYKNNRDDLIRIIYGLDSKYVDYIHDDNKQHYVDLDPFSVFGIFNRNITEQNRKIICDYFKEKLNIVSEIPNDFDSIPLVNNMMSVFVWREQKLEEINNMWKLFEIALRDNFDANEFCKYFNPVRKQSGIKWNITMALYWIQPNKFMPLDENSREYLKRESIPVFKEYDLNGENYLNLLNIIKEKINNREIKEHNFIEISNNAWKQDSKVGDTINTMENKDYSKYINLLRKNRNIILHGAPGTGKTHLAKEIAKEMGCVEDKANPKNSTIGFVQFHPSYDYTDFVEGLRPTSKDENGNILFERKNGIFKDFCKRALENEVNSEKTVTEIQNEKNNEEKFNNFIQEACETDKEFKTKHGNVFKISSYDEDKIYIEIPKNEVYSTINLKYSKFKKILNSKIKLENVTTIRDIFNNSVRLQEDSYYFILCNEFQKYTDKKSSVIVNDKIEKNNYVFIIDEINRGELSKIFGELFFSVDPGYRGKKGNVKTQYQNLIGSEDDFAGGFYIPENVYIIGTMNDIDRSVESMDFAMRRRFAFVEITAEESADNMGLSEKSRNKMNSINQKINEIDGLNKSYNIGGSYFLKVDRPENEEEGLSYDELWKYHLEGLIREYLRGIMASDEQEQTLTEIKAAYDNAE